MVESRMYGRNLDGRNQKRVATMKTFAALQLGCIALFAYALYALVAHVATLVHLAVR